MYVSMFPILSNKYIFVKYGYKLFTCNAMKNKMSVYITVNNIRLIKLDHSIFIEVTVLN